MRKDLGYNDLDPREDTDAECSAIHESGVNIDIFNKVWFFI